MLLLFGIRASSRKLEETIAGQKKDLRKANRKLMSQIGKLKKTETALKEKGIQRKQNLAALQAAKDQWERTFDSVSDIITLQDTDFHISKVNQAGCKMMNQTQEEIVGRLCYAFFWGRDRPCPHCPLLEAKELFTPYSKEIYHESLNKTFLVSVAPVPDKQGNIEYVVHVARDITEQKKMEEQLFLSEKMTTIAGLAAGVAHEINTPLSGIMQSVQIIDESLNPDIKRNQACAVDLGLDLALVREYFKKQELDFFLNGIRSSAENAGHIIKNLLEFSRPQVVVFSCINVNELFENTLSLARTDYDLKKKFAFDKVEVITEYDANLPFLAGGAVELEQVFFNLVKNAVQAMAEVRQEKARLIIRTSRAGNMVRVVVEDNGPGIPPDVKAHIFDPFYTTKDVGTGTGLGLFVAYSIVCDRHKGSLRVESEEGRGARFIVELPLGK